MMVLPRVGWVGELVMTTLGVALMIGIVIAATEIEENLLSPA